MMTSVNNIPSASSACDGLNSLSHSLDSIQSCLSKRHSVTRYAKLNVGGTLFCTTVDTLVKHDTMLRAMFSNRLPVTRDEEGWILIDRSGKHFDFILNCLRDGFSDLQSLLPSTKFEINELIAEARFYCISPLIEACDEALRLMSAKEDEDNATLPELEPVCSIALVRSDEEHLRLLHTVYDMPVIYLAVNRKLNSYSYVEGSDDLILKNIELFDRLCVRFATKAKFHKNVSQGNAICRWTFYSPEPSEKNGVPFTLPKPVRGRTQLLHNIDCTSIVYLTGRIKNIKVEFPEAKILETALNYLMFDPAFNFW